MSLLNSVIEQYDKEKLSDLLKILGVKEPAGDKKSMQEEVYNRLVNYTKMGPEYGPQALYVKCLQITSKYLDIDYIDWVNDSEEETLEFIYDEYKKKIRHKLKKMSKKKRVELAEKYEEYLKSEGYGLAGAGAGLLGALALGEAAGFALFTSTAVGLKSFGLLIGTTFAFNTYSVVMSVLGVVFGPLGWSVAVAIIALGGRKFLMGYRRNKVAITMLTIILDYFAGKEQTLNKQLLEGQGLNLLGEGEVAESSNDSDDPTLIDALNSKLNSIIDKIRSKDE